MICVLDQFLYFGNRNEQQAISASFGVLCPRSGFTNVAWRRPDGNWRKRHCALKFEKKVQFRILTNCLPLIRLNSTFFSKKKLNGIALNGPADPQWARKFKK